MKTEYGIQMYSLRDMTKDDLEAGLRTVAEQGYKYVEFAGFFGHSAETVASWLKKYGLTVSGTHTGAAELAPDKIADTIAYHKIIGNKNIIIPGHDTSTDEKLDGLIDIINYAQPILAENGIRLGYHNHSHEFLKTSYGKYVEEEIWNRTKADIELDTFWAYNAGLDPVDMMEKMKERLTFVHLKDGFRAEGDKKAVGVSLGSGAAPVAAVREKALSMGIIMVVKSEGCDPTGAEEVQRCISYLRTLDC